MKLWKNENMPADQNGVSVQNLKRQMFRQIVTMTVCLAIVSVAAFSFGSRSWYAMNREVSQKDNSVTSSSASPSLFIRASGDSTTRYASVVSTDVPSTTKLFPISTANLTQWYYASGFNYQTTTETANGYSYTINKPIANEYTLATVALDGTYTNDYEGKTCTAYYRSDVNLYTSNGTLNVYLNNTNPITVTYGTTQGSKDLLHALRVGVAVDGTMKFIYVPYDESGTGNSIDASANTLYTISGGTLTPAGANVLTSLSGYTASLAQGSTVLYKADQNALPVCTGVDTSGTNVSVYVWLEGTDAQAIFGTSDDDTAGINVTVNFVGVEN